MTCRVLIVVTHLLGSGHLSRSLALAQAFSRAGHDAHVISGGFPALHLDSAGVTVHQLPPLRSDGVQFARLLTKDGQMARQETFDARIGAMQDILVNVRPHLLITELFPFGRRSLKDEFSSLLSMARKLSPAKIYASVRDILAPPSKPEKADYAQAMIDQFYDGVLVHSDPRVLTLDRSWPVSSELKAKLHYTGFIAPPLPSDPSTDGLDEVLVSAGGGAVGQQLFNVAIAAARLDDRNWRILVGGDDSAGNIAKMRLQASCNVQIEAVRADYRGMLGHANASVSMCGYNTAMDLLRAGTPAVLVPFDEGGEMEQTLRGNALADMPGFEIVPSTKLTPSRLADALARVRSAPPRNSDTIGFDGAEQSVRICMDALS